MTGLGPNNIALAGGLAGDDGGTEEQARVKAGFCLCRSAGIQGCREKVYRIVILRATTGQVPISTKVSSLTGMTCGWMWATPHLALEGNLREWGKSHAHRKYFEKRHMLIQRILMSVETQL